MLFLSLNFLHGIMVRGGLKYILEKLQFGGLIKLERFWVMPVVYHGTRSKFYKSETMKSRESLQLKRWVDVDGYIIGMASV